MSFVKNAKGTNAMMKIKAQFIGGAANKSQFIKSEKPIIAVSGKSNVGKSSFINKLANQKKLARVSKDPGRTRLINYFDMGEFILADLPGYGYAQVSKREKESWAVLLDSFFASPNAVAHVFSLVDIRHNPTPDDCKMIEFLNYHIIPFTIVATKADKLSRAQAQRSVTQIAATLKCGSGNILVSSSQTGQGMNEILAKIESIVSPGKSD